MATIHLRLLPYLPLHSRVTCGPWELVPLKDKDLKWDPSTEAILKTFISRFCDSRGRPLGNPTLIVRKGEKFDGRIVTPEEFQCLLVALQFGCINQNDALTKELNSHHRITAENGSPVVWQFDPSNGYITLSAGSLLRTMDGGWKLDDARLEIRSHPDTHIPSTTVFMPSDIIDAAYAVALAASSPSSPDAEAVRLYRAMTWCNKASQNSSSLDAADRVVMLKTAFEALTGSSRSTESARRLLSMFETLRGEHIDLDDRLLWRPNETKKYIRRFTEKGKQKHEFLTPIEHWFLAFADARNRIIHDGETKVSLSYKHGSSPFNGHMFTIGQWTLRLAIRIRMKSFGSPGLWRTVMNRNWRRAFANLNLQ